MTAPVRPFTSSTLTTAASHTPYPVLHFLHRRCDAPVAVRGTIVLRPTTRPVALPLLKRTHPDSGLHTPCYSCPTHTHTPSLSLHHTLRRLAHARCRFIFPSDRLACLLRLRNTAPTIPSVSSSANSLVTIIPFRFRATLPSQAATCTSLCVASSRNVHTFTRAID